MMKWAHRLLGVLLVVLAFGVSFRVLVPALQGGPEWSALIGCLDAGRNGVIILALGVILGLVAYLLTGFAGSPRPRYLAYETQFGNISISLKALQDFLSHIKSEFPPILALHPRVKALDESLDVVLEVKIRSGAPIPEISRLLQERARMIIQEKIGIAEIRGIEVKVEEIVKEKDARSQEITPVPPSGGEVT